MPPKVNRPKPGGSVDIVTVQGRPGEPANPAALLEHINPGEVPSRDEEGNIVSLPVVNQEQSEILTAAVAASATRKVLA